MAQSLARVLIHMVFATRHREPHLADEFRPAAFEYLGGVLSHADCIPLAVGGMPDHVHLLFGLSRTLTVAQAAEVVKKRSSAWLKGSAGPGFAWQAGYAAFSVSQSSAGAVGAYIHDQQNHHRTRTFQDEYRILLTRHAVEFDERYVWD